MKANIFAELPFSLTVDEAAAVLRVNRKSIYELIHRRALPGVIRVGRSIRISRDSLIAWVQGQGRAR